jgi:hypothetical protein
MTRRALFWAAALLVIGLFVANGNLTGRVMAAQPQPSVCIVEERESRGDNEIVLDIRRPVISGLNNTALQRALNDRVRAQVDAACAVAEAEAAALWQEAHRDGFEPYAYVFHADYEAYCTRGILSMRVTAELDNGGAGFPHTVYYNIDIKQNRWLKLDDLFVANGYREVLSTYILDRISYDEHFFADEFTGVSACTSFFIRDGRLYIAFAKYEIASGTTGEPVFAIPPPLISRLVKPAYAGLLL